MPETAPILIRWLWFFYPSIWVDWAVQQLISWCLSVLEDEDHCDWLQRNKANAAWYGGWLVLAEARLDELIAMKAMRRLKRSWASKRRLHHRPSPGVRTFQDAAHRLNRLIHRYHSKDRLIAARARLLKRELEQAELQLETIHHPIDLQPASDEALGAGCDSVGFFETTVTLPADGRIRAPP